MRMTASRVRRVDFANFAGSLCARLAESAFVTT